MNLAAWAIAIAASGLFTPAMGEVITVDASGNSHVLCAAAQNTHFVGAHTDRNAAAQLYLPLFERMGKRYGISADLLDVLAHQESNYDQRAISSKGAIGIMQLMPATARALGVNPFDVEQNIAGGAAYLRYLLDAYNGQIDLALSAYNAGQAAVARHGGIPPFKETRTYLLRNFEGLAKKSDGLSFTSAADRPAGYIQLCQ